MGILAFLFMHFSRHKIHVFLYISFVTWYIHLFILAGISLYKWHYYLSYAIFPYCKHIRKVSQHPQQGYVAIIFSYVVNFTHVTFFYLFLHDQIAMFIWNKNCLHIFPFLLTVKEASFIFLLPKMASFDLIES